MNPAAPHSLNPAPWTIFRRLLARVAVHRLRLGLIATSLALFSGATLLVPWLAKNLFRDAVLEQNGHAIPFALGCILAAAATMAFGRFLAEDQIGFVSLRVLERLRNDLVAKLYRLPLAYFHQARGGETVSRVFNDVHSLQTFVYDAIFAVGSDVLTVLGCLGCLFYLSWRLALCVLIAVPIAGGLVGVSSRYVRRRFHKLAEHLAEMTALLTEQVSAMPSVLAFGAAEFESRRFTRTTAEHFEQNRLANRLQAGIRASINFLGVAALVLVLGVGTQYLDLTGTSGAGLTLEKLVGFALYAAMLADPMTRLSRTHFEIQRALAAGARVFELLDQPEDRRDGTRSFSRPPAGEVRFEKVHFEYRSGEPVLRGIDLQISPGESVAVVGPSGAGKSTLTGLLLRFFDPQHGRIRVDGIDLKELKLAELRRHIGWASQDPFLFSGTIADNIRYGTWDATIAQIEQAARLACADDFIAELPEGYRTRIGERGVDLSGGQRARLAMARVILRAPPIVILDETTASLDAETEAKLWRDLEPWLARRTTILIAHRLMTILSRPRILVLEKGQIVGDGGAKELRQQCPTFARIFHEQMNLLGRAA